MSRRDQVPAPAPPGELAADAELPVVARLVVEIRSDGRRTVARGGLESVDDGGVAERVAIDARADSPLALVRELTRALAQVPRVAWQARRAAHAAAPPRPSLRGRVRGLLGRPRR
ncbi:MAG: hypothetical protein R2939_05605 [Kofleriaceae bacterium]